MRLKTIVSLSMGENCYIVIDETDGNKPAIVIDPGENGKKINRFINDNGINVTAICLTHCHFDHIGALADVAGHTKAPVMICSGEEIVAQNADYNLTSMAGLPHTVHYDRVLNDGDVFGFGSLSFRVIKTPGHTPGSCCYYFENEGVLFSGDTLFFMSCGRTDFPGGSERDIVTSIREKLFTLPDDVKVYCGHGEHTSIGFEKNNNVLA